MTRTKTTEKLIETYFTEPFDNDDDDNCPGHASEYIVEYRQRLGLEPAWTTRTFGAYSLQNALDTKEMILRDKNFLESEDVPHIIGNYYEWTGPVRVIQRQEFIMTVVKEIDVED